jgi:hypothetical protein
MGWEEDANESLWNSRLVRIPFGMAFILVGVLWARSDLTFIHEYRQWRGDSYVAEGTVVGGPLDQAYGRRPIVEFRDHSGESHEFLSNARFPYFTYSIFRWMFGVNWIDIGERVVVRYSARDPAVAVIDTFWGRTGERWVGVFMGFFVVFIGFGGFVAGEAGPPADD